MLIPHHTQEYFLPQDLYFHLAVQQLGIWNHSNEESEKPIQGRKINSYNCKEIKVNLACQLESKKEKPECTKEPLNI